MQTPSSTAVGGGGVKKRRQDFADVAQEKTVTDVFPTDLIIFLHKVLEYEC